MKKLEKRAVSRFFSKRSAAVGDADRRPIGSPLGTRQGGAAGAFRRAGRRGGPWRGVYGDARGHLCVGLRLASW